MYKDQLQKILEEVATQKLPISEAMDKLKILPFEDIGIARIDHHRAIRKGFPEVILGEYKTVEQIQKIMTHMAAQAANIFVTRLDSQKADRLKGTFPNADYDPISRTLLFAARPIEIQGKTKVAVICAGTSDIPVAEEAVRTLTVMGNAVEKIYDVGVAGMHRLLAYQEAIRQCRVIIVIAGMEGALASVVGGLFDRPIIAVPTSIGYGTSFGGITALLSMLNSCASGVSVVNIDNGFGAAYMASLINQLD
jgi:NCAIR mutase (PurE)-related protein